MGNLRIQRIRGDIQNYVQFFFKSDLLYLKITTYEFKFVAERGDLSSCIIQGHSKHVAEAGHHSVSGLNVGQHQRRNRVQGIKQKMRLQLSFQRVEMRFRQLPLELSCAELSLPKSAVIRRGMCDEHNRHKSSGNV